MPTPGPFSSSMSQILVNNRPKPYVKTSRIKVNVQVFDRFGIREQGKTVPVKAHLSGTHQMTAKRQRNAKDLTDTTDTDYPRFEAWQQDDSRDKHWCLNIRQSANQHPIEIRELPSLRAVEKLIEGFLEDSDPRKTCEK